MSDDTKALVARLRRWHSEGGSLTARDAADTIERLSRELAEAHQIERSDGEVRRELDAKLAEIEADRDALAERCEKLREALRDALKWARRVPDEEIDGEDARLAYAADLERICAALAAPKEGK